MAEQSTKQLGKTQKKKPSETPRLSKKEQYKKDWKLLKLLFRHFIPHKKLLIISAICAPVAIGATVVAPWLTQRIIDNFIMPHHFDGISVWIELLGVTVVVSYLFDAVYTFSLQKSGQLALTDLRFTLFQHSLKLKRTYFDYHPVGETLSRITSDVEALGESLGIGVMSLIIELIKSVALVSFLFYLSWQLALILLFVVPGLYFLISRMRTKLRAYYDITREGLADATAYLQECLQGMKIVQLYLAEKEIIKTFKKKNYRFLHAQNMSNLYDALIYSCVEAIILITLALIIFVGTKNLLSGALTVGILVAFINTLNRLFSPIREFAQQIALIQRSLSALDHINLLLLEDVDDQATQEQAFQGKIEFEELVFKNVSFAYVPGQPVLRDINFTINKGDNIALVGETGSGKTTILQLLTRAYTQYEGSILINGVELATLPKSILMQNMTIMSQDVFLFEEDIAFNILLGRKGLTLDNAKQVAQLIKADQFINTLPDDYHHVLQHNGSNLSAGQAQLLSFCRSIVGDNELVLLDEATSSVDSITENLLQEATNILFQKKTTITIAHRLSTIQNCDKILVLKHGKIIEQGTHQELINQKGFYLSLVQSFSKEEV